MVRKNHQTKQSVWLVYFKSSTNVPSVSWSEAVDEALCFGWIDSTKKTIDKERYMQYFIRRKPNSTWSKINKEKVAKLIQNSLMTQAGFDSIEIAKQNGTWLLMFLTRPAAFNFGLGGLSSTGFGYISSGP